MSARVIPSDALARQARASNPAVSVFVSANAGSGKTHVLVQRVVRLLRLTGVGHLSGVGRWSGCGRECGLQ